MLRQLLQLFLSVCLFSYPPEQLDTNSPIRKTTLNLEETIQIFWQPFLKNSITTPTDKLANVNYKMRSLEPDETYITITVTSQSETSELRQYLYDAHFCEVQHRTSADCDIPPENVAFQCNKPNTHATHQLKIGRLRELKSLFVTNDLISRKHCKITAVDNELAPLSSRFACFLLIIKTLREVQPKHPLCKFNRKILRTIFSYARLSNGYFLYDSGSRNGTFVEVKDYKEMAIHNKYHLAGDKYELLVFNIINTKNQFRSTDNVRSFRTLIKDKKYKNWTILKDSTFDFLEGTTGCDIPDNVQLESAIEIIIKLENASNNYLLLSRRTPYAMGVSCEINLSDPACPFNIPQSTIKYENGKWFIRDGGDSSGPSLFGTWLRLSTEAGYKLGRDESFKLGNAVNVQFQICKRALILP